MGAPSQNRRSRGDRARTQRPAPPAQQSRPTRESLLARIDAVSTRLLVEGIQCITYGELEALASDSGILGNPAAAGTARKLAEHLRTVPPDGHALQAVAEGLSAMHALMIEDAAPTVSSDPQPFSSAYADPELLADFLVECHEHLAQIEAQALALENEGGDSEAIHAVFRTFHTIKGLAGFLNLEAIQEVSHQTEALLDRVRKGELSITRDIVDAVLQAADFLESDLRRIETEASGATLQVKPNGKPIIQKIAVLITGGAQPERMARNDGEQPPPNIRSSAPDLECERDLTEVPLPSVEVSGPPEVPNQVRSAERISVRVDTAKLDHLMNMVGEMVIAQSLILHDPLLAGFNNTSMQTHLSELSRSAAEVQRTAISMRMVPIGQMFHRTARMVRDLSHKLGKEVKLETSGEDTEIDKTIAEELADPLLHMVRNSLDHGIESPDERSVAGKDPVGRIRLSASHQAGEIVIEISDDGRGLDRDKILRKAIQNGIVTHPWQLPDAEVHHLIFRPGFSTAELVTDVSGRGVGMDVVLRNVQKLRGRIDVQSSRGEGSRFFIRLPLTLAIIDGLVVVVGASRYILPLFAVHEVFRPSAGMLSTYQAEHEMVLVRGTLVPIVRLHARFGIAGRAQALCDGILIVAEAHGKRFCLFVDELIGKQEVVLKSLGPFLKDAHGLAGCAILGDGGIGLILDLDAIYCGARR